MEEESRFLHTPSLTFTEKEILRKKWSSSFSQMQYLGGAKFFWTRVFERELVDFLDNLHCV